MVKGSALRILGRHDEAVSHCRQACRVPDCGFLPYVHLTAALAEAGQIHEARATFANTMKIEPAFSITFIRSNLIGANESVIKSLLDSLRKAGVPE